MYIDVWLSLLTTAFFISISPGPGAVNTINQSIQYGFKNSLVSIAGLQFGWFIQIVVVSAGIGAIIMSSPVLFNFVKWAGVIYIIALGIQQWLFKLNHFDFSLSTDLIKFNSKKEFWKACAVNLVNLKATIFLLTFIPLFINNQGSKVLQLSVIATTLVLVDILVMLSYAGLSHKFRLLFNDANKIKWLNRLTGTVLIFIGLSMAYQLKIT